MSIAAIYDVPAPAKLNLYLHVVGRRADGYHLLQTLFQLLDYGDEVSITLRDDGVIRRVGDVEGGWRVEYKAFDETQSPPLPTRIVAERAPYEVRLAVAEWRRE